MTDSKRKEKLIVLDEEDILNLENAKERILNTLYIDNYEALEVFTIQGIIKKYYSAST
jgi:hypothetical protein